jgi:hypothetical protein
LIRPQYALLYSGAYKVQYLETRQRLKEFVRTEVDFVKQHGQDLATLAFPTRETLILGDDGERYGEFDDPYAFCTVARKTAKFYGFDLKSKSQVIADQDCGCHKVQGFTLQDGEALLPEDYLLYSWLCRERVMPHVHPIVQQGIRAMGYSQVARGTYPVFQQLASLAVDRVEDKETLYSSDIVFIKDISEHSVTRRLWDFSDECRVFNSPSKRLFDMRDIFGKSYFRENARIAFDL